jgi:AbrB family looped-hinge helix DNA binding protein
MAPEVKTSRQRGTTKISSKHQVTIPVQAMRDAGLRPGDRLRVQSTGKGRVVLEREATPHDFEAALGSLTGMYRGFDLEALRREWD